MTTVVTHLDLLTLIYDLFYVLKGSMIYDANVMYFV